MTTKAIVKTKIIFTIFYMTEQSTIKQISIGEQLYNIDAKYWGG